MDRRGRDPESLQISKRVYIALDDDSDRAERRVNDLFGASHDRTDMGSDMAVWGSVEQCVEGLMEVVEAGAGMLMLDPLFDHEEQIERLASEIAPKLGPPISG